MRRRFALVVWLLSLMVVGLPVIQGATVAAQDVQRWSTNIPYMERCGRDVGSQSVCSIWAGNVPSYTKASGAMTVSVTSNLGHAQWRFRWFCNGIGLGSVDSGNYDHDEGFAIVRFSLLWGPGFGGNDGIGGRSLYLAPSENTRDCAYRFTADARGVRVTVNNAGFGFERSVPPGPPFWPPPDPPESTAGPTATPTPGPTATPGFDSCDPAWESLGSIACPSGGPDFCEVPLPSGQYGPPAPCSSASPAPTATPPPTDCQPPPAYREGTFVVDVTVLPDRWCPIIDLSPGPTGTRLRRVDISWTWLTWTWATGQSYGSRHWDRLVGKSVTGETLPGDPMVWNSSGMAASANPGQICEVTACTGSLTPLNGVTSSRFRWYVVHWGWRDFNVAELRDHPIVVRFTIVVDYEGGIAPTPRPTATPGPAPTPGHSFSLDGGPDPDNPAGIPDGPGTPRTPGTGPGGFDPGDIGPGTGPGGSCAVDMERGPISGLCKPFLLHYQAVGTCTSPDGFNPLDWLGYLGCWVSGIPTTVGNALAYAVNAALDLIIPATDLVAWLEDLIGLYAERVPFAWVDEVQEGVTAGLAAGAVQVDTTLDLGAVEVDVPLYESLDGLGAYRGVIFGAIALLVGFGLMRRLAGALGVGGGSGGADE